MGQGPSDWERGVLAAVKWLRDEAKRKGDTENDGAAFALLSTCANRMVHVLTPTPDDEGTERRVVKQIATFFRESAVARPLIPVPEAHDALATRMLKGIADSIERGDWRRS